MGVRTPDRVIWSASIRVEAHGNRLVCAVRPTKEAEVRYQLRDYRITPGAMTEFVSEWRAGVMPLRSQAGFEIVGAWSNPETNRFVWVVAHQGDFEEADRMYYESPERSRLSPDPARFIEEAKAEFVTPAI